MRRNLPTYLILWMLGAGPVLLSQEPPSAELFLEPYSDTFQEKFFEALKEKGIENYDRAAALFMECKQIQPENPVIDHELAKTLSAYGELDAAEAYALNAVEAEPTEFWYLNTLMNILAAQYKSLQAAAPGLPYNLPAFRLNLARWYLDQSDSEKALSQLENLPETPEVAQLRNRAMRLADAAEGAGHVGLPAVQPAGPEEGSTAHYMQLLESHLAAGRWEQAKEVGSEAIELYPVQPFFYYAKGQALLSSGEPSEAVAVLEMGESMLLEEDALAQRIYKALAEAYSLLGNEEKARSYQTRLKTGS